LPARDPLSLTADASAPEASRNRTDTASTNDTARLRMDYLILSIP
jgi:hypothetical protein